MNTQTKEALEKCKAYFMQNRHGSAYELLELIEQALSEQEPTKLQATMTKLAREFIAAREEQPAQEPYAWTTENDLEHLKQAPDCNMEIYAAFATGLPNGDANIPLYISPVQLKTLTYDEISALFVDNPKYISGRKLARAIEQALALKNGMELSDE